MILAAGERNDFTNPEFCVSYCPGCVRLTVATARECNMSRRLVSVAVLAGCLVVAAAGPAAAQAPEECIPDGDVVPGSRFRAPTMDTTPVRVRMNGYAYDIPRNYFDFPSVSCETGEHRSIVLRMTLPDLMPRTTETAERLDGPTAARDETFVTLLGSQSHRPYAELLAFNSAKTHPDRPPPPIPGLTGRAVGPIDPQGWHTTDLYFAPTASDPEYLVRCNPVGRNARSLCRILFRHNGSAWKASTYRDRVAAGWDQIVMGLRTTLDSFLVR